MRGMDFHHFETGFEGPPGGRYKGFGDGVKFIYGQLLGQRVIVGKANGAGSYRGPAACHGGYLALMWTPGAIRTCLASGMRQLNARPAALAMNERDDSGEFRDVLILPDAEVLRGDAPMGRHCGGFGKDQSRTAHRARCKMDEVPIVGKTILTGVLAHGRDHNAVREFEAPKG